MLNKKKYQENEVLRNKMKESLLKDPLLPDFHIYPETGWLNDPNGLCYYQGLYHIFFQYSPLDENRSDIIWGHLTSKDLINFKREEPFIYEDSAFDKNGAYSGSAFIKDNVISFFYTGNVKHPGDFDYINEGREHNTIKIVSDGFSYDKKELVMDNDSYPKDMTKHVRDPKIYEKNGNFYMFLGARSKNDKGIILVFKSKNLIDFSYHMRIETDYDFGYMWECPDFFDLNNKSALICCPQGVKSEEFKYQNIYQSGYFIIDLDLENKSYKLGDFEELDYGFDMYAPQTFEDKNNRRILIGWMGMPDAAYTNPSTKYKWQHILTIPRVLSIKNGKIYQNPIKELEKLRNKAILLEKGQKYENLVFEGLVEVKKDYFHINLREDVNLSYEDKILILSMGKSSAGRDKRKIKIEKIHSLRIFSDKSSLEIFINDGEYVMTSRVYSKKPNFSTDDLSFTIYPLNKISIK